LYNALLLYPTIVIICNILASNLNFNNFGFNWAITIIMFLAYSQILNRSHNNKTLSRLRIHKHNQQVNSALLYTLLNYTILKKNQTQFIILNNHKIPILIHSYSTKSITFQNSVQNYNITIILIKIKTIVQRKSNLRWIIRIFLTNNG